MEFRIQNISDRLLYIDLDTAPLELTRLSPLEVMNHLMWIDACTTGGYFLTNEQVDRCRQRIIAFAITQFENRN